MKCKSHAKAITVVLDVLHHRAAHWAHRDLYIVTSTLQSIVTILRLKLIMPMMSVVVDVLHHRTAHWAYRDTNTTKLSYYTVSQVEHAHNVCSSWCFASPCSAAHWAHRDLCIVTKAGNESRENESRSKMFSPGSRIRLLDTRK